MRESLKQQPKQNNNRCVVLVLILVLVGFEFVRSSFGTFSVVEGSSMYPTFRPNDVVQARTLYVESPRGSVVIITDDQGDHAIKRIIGLPGETVTLYRGFVYINGQRLREPYLPGHTYTFKSNQEDERAAAWQLGDSQYFVLGDNRLESHDSRNFGPVERSQINRVVNLPDNATAPGFLEVMLSETGKVTPGKHRNHVPGRNLSRDHQLNSAAKI